jgi:putrescine transport system substrate-binding protein
MTCQTPSGTRSISAARVACLVIALLLAACGDKHPQPGGTEVVAAAKAPDTENVINVYNWSDYIEPAVLEKFTEETGIKVNYDVYDSNELLETKMLAGNSGYDVVVPSGIFINRLIDAGAFRKLDRAMLPNWSNLDPEILQSLMHHDPGNQYGVNYMWGTSGIGYNVAKVRSIMPDAPVDSWGLVFDPAVASKFKECGIAVIDSPRDLRYDVLVYLGKDPNSESPEDLALLEQTLLAIRPYVRMIDTFQYTDALASGEICIAVGWNGDVLQARARAGELGQGTEIGYSIPKEGTLIWFDMLAIPKDAPHPENAHAFINFLQRADIAAANTNFIKYANGNSASFPLVDASIRNDEAVYPPAAIRAKLIVGVPESEPYSRQLNRTWSRFVTGK